MKDAWVLKMKTELCKLDNVDYYFIDDGIENLTNDINQATIFEDKKKEIENMKEHERLTFEKFGPDAICDAGFTNMMKNFDFVEVEIEEIE